MSAGWHLGRQHDFSVPLKQPKPSSNQLVTQFFRHSNESTTDEILKSDNHGVASLNVSRHQHYSSTMTADGPSDRTCF